MKKTELVPIVRDLLQDDAFSQDTIVRAANWFQNELCNKNRLRIMEESDLLTANIGDTTADLPNDIQRIVTLYVTAPQKYDLMKNYREYGEFMELYPDFATATQHQLSYWTDWGNAMRFSAPLNAAHTIQIDYLRRPKKVSKDGDSWEFPDQYDEMLAKGTLVRCMEINEDYDEAARERALLQPLVTDFIKNEARGQIKTGPVIMRTNRRRIWNGEIGDS